MIALSCGIKTSAVHCLVLSQNTRVTNGRTDRITTPKTGLASLCRAVKTIELKQQSSRSTKLVKSVGLVG